MNINEANMDLKDTVEAQNSPKNQLKEVTLYQLVDPDGEYVGEPNSDYLTALLDSPRQIIDSYPDREKLDRVLNELISGYKVIEVTYIPKQ